MHVNVTVTLELFQPAAFGAGESTAVIAGPTTGWIFNVTLAELEFPALSVAVPVTTCPAPIVVCVIGEGQLATPDKPSVQVNVTVALPKLIPPTGVGVTTAVIIGGVSSRFTLTLVLAVAPDESTTVPLTCWFAPSVLTTTGEGQVCIA